MPKNKTAKKKAKLAALALITELHDPMILQLQFAASMKQSFLETDHSNRFEAYVGIGFDKALLALIKDHVAIVEVDTDSEVA